MDFPTRRMEAFPKMVGPYEILNQDIGFGSTGVVKLAQDRFGAKFAVKIVSQRDVQLKNEALREIAILRSLRHRNIIEIKHVEELKDYIYIFTEYQDNGDLYSQMLRNGNFTEETARPIFVQMVDALAHCHQSRVCHHDFKLENCVIDSRGHLKVIDFAYAVEFDSPTKLLRDYHGSPVYSAPEILFRKPHDSSVDIFSLGICVFYMLAGYFPFAKDEENTSFEQLCRNVRSFNLIFPAHFSVEVKDLLSKLLKLKDRVSWEEIKQHPWYRASSRAPLPSTSTPAEDLMFQMDLA